MINCPGTVRTRKRIIDYLNTLTMDQWYSNRTMIIIIRGPYSPWKVVSFSHFFFCEMLFQLFLLQLYMLLIAFPDQAARLASLNASLQVG